MNWATLYTARRTGDTRDKPITTDIVRNAFLRDYDRIIFSSPFRRLQNKTQVFPLPGSIFVHNRLTHSLEVASVGRSLGKSVGEKIAARYNTESEDFREFYRHELASVIASACLGHDIGNPPFGHSGEDAIRTFFKNISGDTKTIIEDALSPGQLSDFRKFEGNSNALRVLTHSFNEPDPGGYGLTYTTLASLVKYPCIASEGFNKDTGLIATKKAGFFDSELEIYREIADTLQIPQISGYQHVYARHPFVYITEAADDICYRVIDMEDAHRLHIVSYETFCSMFLPFFEGQPESYNTREYIEQKLSRITDHNQKVQYIRARWIGLMIDKVANAFMANETALLAGTLEKDLLKCLSPADHQLIERINEYSVRYIYNYKAVVEIEIAGYNVIGGLLKEFVQAALHPKDSKSAKLLKLVSSQFPLTGKREHIYSDIQSLIDFIAGMTDLYAIDLYRKITGITIPEIR
ncbi:MAG: dNTP triphosphohydrolase [Bacteroidota bacterium]